MEVLLWLWSGTLFSGYGMGFDGSKLLERTTSRGLRPIKLFACGSGYVPREGAEAVARNGEGTADCEPGS